MKNRKIISLILLLSLVISAGCGQSEVQEDSEPKEKKVEKQVVGERMSERFAPCSDLYYYEENYTEKGLVQRKWTREKVNSFSYADLGLPDGSNISYINATDKELLLICRNTKDKKKTSELWSIPLRQQGKEETIEIAKRRKLFESRNGLSSCFKVGDIICFYDGDSEYNEYNLTENDFIKQRKDEQFTYCNNHMMSDADWDASYWRECVENGYIILSRLNKKKKDTGEIWIHKIGTKTYTKLLDKKQRGDVATKITSGDKQIFIGTFNYNLYNQVAIYKYDTSSEKLQCILTEKDFLEPGVTTDFYKVASPVDIYCLRCYFDNNYFYIYCETNDKEKPILLYSYNVSTSSLHLEKGFVDVADTYGSVFVHTVYGGQCYLEDMDKAAGVLMSYNLKTGEESASDAESVLADLI